MSWIHLYSGTFIIALFLQSHSLRMLTHMHIHSCPTIVPFRCLRAHKRKRTDHVQIMGLSVCTIYCPPSTRFLYKFLLTPYFFSCFAHLAATLCRLHKRKHVCTLPSKGSSSSSGGPFRDEILAISSWWNMHHYVVLLHPQHIQHVSQFLLLKWNAFSSTVIGFKAACRRFWGANRSRQYVSVALLPQ